MAIYHFAAQIMGRGQGRKHLDGSAKTRADNVVAAAAYRAGERLVDRVSKRREGEVDRTYDFSRRRGIRHAEIIVPDGGAACLADREELWNLVERERRKDAQLSREINAAVPFELTPEDQLEMVRGFIREQFISRGMVVDFALHDPVAERGDDPRNVHVHMMLTLRKATKTGLHEVKTREWNSRSLLEDWRKLWAVHTNRALERAGRSERIDHRTLEAQREAAMQRGDRAAAAELDRQPETHIGPRARQIDGRVLRKDMDLPRSRVRERSLARPGSNGFVSPRKGKPRSRIVDYALIDGSLGRAAFVRELVQGAEQRNRQTRERYEGQQARLRERLWRAGRESARAEALARGELNRQAARPFWGRGDLTTAGNRWLLLAQQKGWQERHRQRGQNLIDEISRTLAGLLNRQQRQRSRLQELLRIREKDLPRMRPRGRGRSRGEQE